MKHTNISKNDARTKTGRRFVGGRAIAMAAALLIGVGAITMAPWLSLSPALAQVDGATTATGSEGLQIEEGTVTSAPDPLPGHSMHQAALILPPKPDGSEYVGTLTYTASKPVEVVVLQDQNLNSTEQTMLSSGSTNRGALLTAPLNGQTVAIVLITPDYGRTPIPSASIPFSGNALALHTLSGEPFIASYSVTYSVHHPEVVNSISNNMPTASVSSGGAATTTGGSNGGGDNTMGDMAMGGGSASGGLTAGGESSSNTSGGEGLTAGG
ncbi:MAG: hypothetical protein M3247_03545 [Thermoproteota archaeon]|nr:hypothetical protein [Thermoproteota archaeon]